jgi:hypothetical protein
MGNQGGKQQVLVWPTSGQSQTSIVQIRSEDNHQQLGVAAKIKLQLLDM